VGLDNTHLHRLVVNIALSRTAGGRYTNIRSCSTWH
jgi:hypothetical protein